MTSRKEHVPTSTFSNISLLQAPAELDRLQGPLAAIEDLARVHNEPVVPCLSRKSRRAGCMEKLTIYVCKITSVPIDFEQPRITGGV